MKNFNNYLENFNEMNLWDEVFPGANINTKFVDSKNFTVVIANLFKNESTDGLESRLVQEYKIDGDTASEVLFLIKFLKFKPEDVFDVYKKKQQCAIDDSTILEWLDVNNITDIFIKFVEYKPSVSAQDLMSKGFKGAELGREIKRLEIEKFKQVL